MKALLNKTLLITLFFAANTVNAAAVCTATVSGELYFGMYVRGQFQDKTAIQSPTIEVDCEPSSFNDTIFQEMKTVNIRMDFGLNQMVTGGARDRNMVNGGDHLSYQIYLPNNGFGAQTIWGETTNILAGEGVYSMTLTSDNPRESVLVNNAVIMANQTPAAKSQYTDTITVNVEL